MKAITIKTIVLSLILLTGKLSAQKNYDVQSVGINVSYDKAFSFISQPKNLPLWTNAFSKADDKTAMMSTPKGQLQIKLQTSVSNEKGTIDWIMTMPDGSIGRAYSRITKNIEGVIYEFVLLAPPVPLEQLEGALSAQKQLLAQELIKLKEVLEK